jgi:hypothetical protein
MPQKATIRRASPIAELVELVPPPQEPIDVDSRRWTALQRTVGLPFPTDLRTLSETYGTGIFRAVNNDFAYVWIYNPLSRWYERDIQYACNLDTELLDFIEDREERTRRENIFPKTNGDLPIGGVTELLQSFWYRQEGDSPDGWPIVVWNGKRHEPDSTMDAFSEGLIPFLVRYLKGEVRIDRRKSSFLPARFHACSDVHSIPLIA